MPAGSSCKSNKFIQVLARTPACWSAQTDPAASASGAGAGYGRNKAQTAHYGCPYFFSCGSGAGGAHLLDVGHHETVAGGHGYTNVVCVPLQQRPASWLQACVEAGVPAQADAERLDHKRKVRQLGTCAA
jgi:hypothetical protein